MLRVALLLICAVVASGDGVTMLDEPVEEPNVERAKAMTKRVEEQLKALDSMAPGDYDPWEGSEEATLSPGESKLEIAPEGTRSEAEKDADADLNSVPERQSNEEKVKKEVEGDSEPSDAGDVTKKGRKSKELGQKPRQRPAVPHAVNMDEHSGSTDPQIPNAAMEAAKFGKELTEINQGAVKAHPADVSETDANVASPLTSTSYMKSYDDTMREIKVKDLKRQAMQQTIDHAVLLKARALNDEKKTVAKAEKGKVEYLEAKLDQAQQSLEAAKTAGTSDLPPEVAGNLVAEEEENVRSISLKLRQEKNKERKMKLIAKRHKTEKGVENDLHRRKELLAQAKAAYNKHLAMNYVEEEAEQHTKQRESAKLKESERQRKRKITEELAVKRSAAKESQEKTLENRNKGLEQAKLLESTDPNACQVSTWSSYGQCSKPCGGGMQTSTRSVIKPGANPQSCPSLAKGKPCNMHACPEPQARKSTSEEACAAMISACGEFQARVSACEAHPKVDLAKQPMSNETQMIIATEYSKPDPLDDPTTVYHYLDQPDEPLDHDIDIHDMGEAAEIRAAIAHLPSTARLLLASPPHDHEVEFCATAKKEAARHCKIAKDCVGSHNNVGESLSDDLSSQKVPMYARPVSAIGQHAKGKYPQDQEFDETLSHLVLGPAGGH